MAMGHSEHMTASRLVGGLSYRVGKIPKNLVSKCLSGGGDLEGVNQLHMI